jgi:hypothetical protein
MHVYIFVSLCSFDIVYINVHVLCVCPYGLQIDGKQLTADMKKMEEYIKEAKRGVQDHSICRFLCFIAGLYNQ